MSEISPPDNSGRIVNHMHGQQAQVSQHAQQHPAGTERQHTMKPVICMPQPRNTPEPQMLTASKTPSKATSGIICHGGVRAR